MKALRKASGYLNKALLLIPVWAAERQEVELVPKGEPWNTLGNIRVAGIVSALIQLVLVIAAVVAFFYLLIGGVKWITSGGDKEQTAKAQGTITAALIGLLIVFAAWAIIKLIETFFGLSIITKFSIPSVSHVGGS
jgi:hypothetical protein